MIAALIPPRLHPADVGPPAVCGALDGRGRVGRARRANGHKRADQAEQLPPHDRHAHHEGEDQVKLQRLAIETGAARCVLAIEARERRARDENQRDLRGRVGSGVRNWVGSDWVRSKIRSKVNVLEDFLFDSDPAAPDFIY